MFLIFQVVVSASIPPRVNSSYFLRQASGALAGSTLTTTLRLNMAHEHAVFFAASVNKLMRGTSDADDTGSDAIEEVRENLLFIAIIDFILHACPTAWLAHSTCTWALCMVCNCDQSLNFACEVVHV